MACAAHRSGSTRQASIEHHLEGAVVTGLLDWFIRRIGKRSLLQLTLLYFALWSTAFGLVGVVLKLDLTLLTWTLTIGVLSAWLAARSKLKGGWAAVLLTAFGLVFILIFQGQTGDPLFVLMVRLMQFLSTFLHWLFVKKALPPDPTLLSMAIGDLQIRFATLVSHSSAWLASITAGHIATDALANSLVWGAFMWAVSSWAAWQTRRCRQGLRALLPAAALLAAVLNFTRPKPFILIPVILFAFILMITLEQQQREQHWERQKIDYSTEIGVDTAITTIPVLLVILGVATLAPSISIGKIVELARNLTQKQTAQVSNVGQSLGLRPQAGSGYFFYGGTGSTLPQVHLIGSGPELSKHIVMEIQLIGNPAQDGAGVNYYWRSLTYDIYTGAGWASSESKVINYNAGDQPVSSSVPAHRLVRQEIHLEQDSGGPLFHAGGLVSADQDYQIAWRLPLETGPDMFGASIAKRQYSVKSLVPVVSQEELRHAGTNYPEWLKERYLELPPSLPGRVRDLARSLTHDQPSAFDQAIAIQNYLRTYTYTLDLPAPPVNLDIADYFLFDLKKGYCDYYATAMVVLARAAGIPARFVTGYASGKFDSNLGKYIVTEADAHSWPEIYFPQYGWVEFEPTAGHPAILLPERLSPSENLATGGNPPLFEWLRQFRPGLTRTAGLVGILLILIGIGWQTGNAWRLRSLEPVQAAAFIYRRFRKDSFQLDPTLPVGETPFELSDSTLATINNLNDSKLWAVLFRPVMRDADQIVKFYALAEYSQHLLLPAEKRMAIKAWERLGWRLQLARFWKRLTKRNKVL
jgi:hypothetical protein